MLCSLLSYVPCVPVCNAYMYFPVTGHYETKNAYNYICQEIAPKSNGKQCVIILTEIDFLDLNLANALFSRHFQLLPLWITQNYK
jgi:hypothetical protein